MCSSYLVVYFCKRDKKCSCCLQSYYCVLGQKTIPDLEVELEPNGERKTIASTLFPLGQGAKFLQFSWKFKVVADIISITVSVLL